LGTGLLGRQVMRAIAGDRRGAYTLVGAIAESAIGVGDRPAAECAMLGSLPDFEQIVETTRPDCIVVAVGQGDGGLPERLLHVLLRSNVEIRDAADFYEGITGKLAIDSLTPASFLFGRELRPSPVAMRLNRIVSLCIAGLGLALATPLMVAVALAVRIDSPGPALFVQERVGFGGRRFRLLKFRSMRVDGTERSVWVDGNADRITRVGAWLRKFRLDELPQFINVLRGDMNIVGPRPHPSSSCELVNLISRNVAECGNAVPYYSLRSLVRPGITGWAQVRYKYANGLSEELEKLRYDLYYVKHYSLWLDIRILAMTISVVLRGDGGRSGGERTPARGVAQPVPRLPVSPEPDAEGMRDWPPAGTRDETVRTDGTGRIREGAHPELRAASRFAGRGQPDERHRGATR